jgi:hypothetical protein
MIINDVTPGYVIDKVPATEIDHTSCQMLCLHRLSGCVSHETYCKPFPYVVRAQNSVTVLIFLKGLRSRAIALATRFRVKGPRERSEGSMEKRKMNKESQTVIFSARV